MKIGNIVILKWEKNSQIGIIVDKFDDNSCRVRWDNGFEWPHAMCELQQVSSQEGLLYKGLLAKIKDRLG